MEDAREEFVHTHLGSLNLESLLNDLRNSNSASQICFYMRSAVTSTIRPFLEQKLQDWRTISRYELGKELFNVVISLDYLMSIIDENVSDVNPELLIQMIFKKTFMEKFQESLVRLVKYHYVLDTKGGAAGRKRLTYTGKIKEALEILYNIDYLSDYIRSCVVLATSEIVSFEIKKITKHPVSQIDVDYFASRQHLIEEWLFCLPIVIEDLSLTFIKYMDCVFVNRLCHSAFEIFITEYPQTDTLIRYMKGLMSNNDWFGRELLLNSLMDSIKQKLLHVGVNTKEILKAYARCVESLIVFDDSFVLVHKVCDLIKKYVKSRSDTVRTIIHFITAEKPGEFSDRVVQLVDRDNLTNVNDEYVIMVEDSEKERWDQWQPDPYDANPAESRLFRESADVFNMLVSIYDSPDMFVKEYQRLLASSLVGSGWGRQMDSEIQYLETMKKRFTDGELNQCEVMLRDIQDSSRLYNFAVGDGMDLPFFPRIISNVFWPEIKKDSKFKIIAPFSEYIERYRQSFEKKRTGRTVNWFNDYGSNVKLDVKIGNCTIDVETPLSFAQILMPFLKREQNSIEELMEAVEMDRSSVTKRLEWWKEKGILCEANAADSMWTIAVNTTRMERQSKQICFTSEEQQDSDEEEEQEVPIEDQVDGLEQYWLYTKNLLLYHSVKDPLTPAKLATMYKMFASPGKPPPTIEAVMLFMQRKVRQNLVVFENGTYKPDKELKNVFTG